MKIIYSSNPVENAELVAGNKAMSPQARRFYRGQNPARKCDNSVPDLRRYNALARARYAAQPVPVSFAARFPMLSNPGGSLAALEAAGAAMQS